jgi:hypothetical protein
MNRFEYQAVQAGLKLDEDLRKMQDDLRADLDSHRQERLRDREAFFESFGRKR